MKAKTTPLRFILLAVAMFLMTPVHAWEPVGVFIRIPLLLTDVYPGIGLPRTPIEEPQIGQADHTLYFLDETALTLNIYSEDEDGNETLEFTTSVSATTTEVQLPSSLSGTYIIEVVRDTLCFRGEIEL